MRYVKSKMQRGSAFLTIVAALSVLGIMGAVVGSNLLLNDQTVIRQEIGLDTLTHLDKALSLASYFVTNNLILCRDHDEGKWSSPIESECIWGGEKYSLNKDGETISLKFYNLIDVSLAGKYTLRVPAKHIILSEKENRTIDIDFEISDISQDSGLKGIIGTKDSSHNYLDQDNKVIIISAEAKHKGKPIGRKSALIRRPFATPVLNVASPPACNLVCVSGKSHNPNKECRSKNDILRSFTVVSGAGTSEEKDDKVEGENHVTLTVRNDGPGAIYKLKFFKKTTFDKKNYPDMANTMESVDVMSNGEDVLMPGKVMTYEDKIPCLPPAQKTQVKSRRGWGGGTNVYNSVHKENYMDLSYGFNFENKNSDIIPRRLAEEFTTDNVDVTRDVGVTTIINYFSPPH